MISKATTAVQYIKELPDDRREAIKKLRDTIIKNLPTGFKEEIGYGMLGYVIPHSIYPPGYHCNPDLPLPFVDIACQKFFNAFYHMGMYAMPEVMKWFIAEYPKHSNKKLDMGKSCLRFKINEDIPYKLIGELVKKISVKEWIAVYEKNIKK